LRRADGACSDVLLRVAHRRDAALVTGVVVIGVASAVVMRVPAQSHDDQLRNFAATADEATVEGIQVIRPGI
jgi:hypothetical protein